jgi:hypothetical protein
MIYHWTDSSNNIFVRHDSVEQARKLFELSCTARSTLRKRCAFVLTEEPKELSDSLGYIFDRKLGDKTKDIYFFDCVNVQMYLSKGYKPKPIKPLFTDEN